MDPLDIAERMVIFDFDGSLYSYIIKWKDTRKYHDHYYSEIVCSGISTLLWELFIYDKPLFIGDKSNQLFQTNSIIPLPIINDAITIDDMNKLADRLKKLGAFA